MNLEELMASTPPMQQHTLIKGFQAGATSRDDEVATLRELKQLYQTERDQLREQVALLRSHMTTFVRRCDLGEIRSNKTYASFVKALADTEPKK